MIFEKFKETIRKYGMLSEGEKVAVALSGGADSVVLFYLLNRFVSKEGGSLVAAHLNHGLRGEESDRDERFVKELAGEMNIPFVSKKIDLKKIASEESLNIQDAGRRERYGFFDSVMDRFGCNRVALGHTADDQAETVLMRLIRGTGIKGLGGIPPARDNVIRPLIEISREEIEACAKEEGIVYVEDSSNRERKYLRNRVRQELLPLLKEYNPGVCDELTHLSGIAREMEAYLDVEACRAFEGIRLDEDEEGVACIDAAGFNALPLPLRAKVVVKVFEALSGSASGLFSVHISDVVRLISDGRTGSSLDLPKDVRAIIEYDKAIFTCGKPEKTPDFSCPLNLEGETFVPEAGVTLSVQKGTFSEDERGDGKSCIFLDMDKIAPPLEVRNFRKGDRVRFEGMEGRKKLKDFFIDEKVPRNLRRRIPLLVSGDEIVWIVGFRRCGNASADAGTINVLKVVNL